MEDSEIGSGGGSAVNSAVLATLFKPNPSINILKVWEGIVEIALRIASLVLLFILFICTCAALANYNVGSVGAAPGWILFLTIIGIPAEGLILASRFLNFGFATKFALIVHIVDICVCFGLAVVIFCGAIAVGVYAGQLSSIIGANVISSSYGATSAFGFFTLFVFVGLGVWMILSLVFKLRNQTKYSASSGGGEDEYTGGGVDVEQ